MTNKEAIAILKRLQDPEPWEPLLNSAAYDALNMAISALEKQEGKKPIEAKNVYPSEQFECPVCWCCVGRHKTLRKVNDLIGEVLTDCKVEFNFCPDCGQKILWE